MRARRDVDPDRLGLCCVCLAAGYPDFVGAAAFDAYTHRLNDARRQQFDSHEVQYMPAVAGPPHFAPAAMPVQEAFEYFTAVQPREARTGENRLSAASMEHIIGWSVIGHAHR